MHKTLNVTQIGSGVLPVFDGSGRQPHWPALVEVAAIAGLAGQAHLCRDVRDLAGTTPARLRASQPGRRANKSTGVPSGSWTTA
jgi:hypothetical protein